MKEIVSRYFDLEQISASGQCFRMSGLDDERYEIIACDKRITASQTLEDAPEGKTVRVILSCSEEEYESFWKHYFDMETDYGKIIGMIDPEDEYLNAAARKVSGIRILNQDLWEMTVTFLISQQNNIKRIKRCIDNISREYGRRMTDVDGTVYYAFPQPEDLSMLADDDLMPCNLGYRSKYVVRTAKMVTSGEIDLDAVKSMDCEQARESLLKLYGVGKKVADCIRLFALHQLDAFPVDTHIRQVLDAHYPDGFPFEKYAGYNGVMQQYMFYDDLFKNKT